LTEAATVLFKADPASAEFLDASREYSQAIERHFTTPPQRPEGSPNYAQRLPTMVDEVERYLRDGVDINEPDTDPNTEHHD